MTLEIQAGHPVTADVAKVEGSAVRFVGADGRCLFEVRVVDSKTIEVRAVETVKLDGEIYDHRLSVMPRSSNSMEVSLVKYS